MIDRSYIGRKFPPYIVEVEKGQLRLFAKSVSEGDPLYTNEGAAIALGCASLPAPPTFGFSLSLAKPDMFEIFEKMGINLGKLLHGEQQFEYFAPICAGDTITLQDEVVDIYDKQPSGLEFIVLKTTLINQNEKKVCEMTNTLVVRN